MDKNPGPTDLMADLLGDSAELFYGAEDCKSLRSARVLWLATVAVQSRELPRLYF
jgi:hypothetical protein